MKFVISAFVATVFLGVFAGSAGAAQDRRELEGRELFAKGEYVKAIDVYAKLFAEKGDPIYLRNVGRCHQKLKQPEKAIDAFREYLRRSQVKARERQEVEGFIKEMEEMQAKQAPAPITEPPPVVATTSNGAARPAAPPPSTAVSSAPAPTQLPPATDPGRSNPPEANLVGGPAPGAAEESTPITHRWWFWTGIGVVVAGGVVGAILLTRGGPDKLPCGSGVDCGTPTTP